MFNFPRAGFQPQASSAIPPTPIGGGSSVRPAVALPQMATETLVVDTSATLDGLFTIATETYDDPTTSAAQPNGAQSDRPRRRYGAIQVPLPAVDRFAPAILPFHSEEGNLHRIYILTPIVETTDFANAVADIVQICDAAAAGDRIEFYISSPGGSVDVACRIISAMRRSRARVITTAIGLCASAGSFIWAYGQELRIAPGAVFMFHMSKHGDGGHSPAVAENARLISGYIREVALDYFVSRNILTEEEVRQIYDERREIYIDAAAMAERLANPGAQA